MNNQTLITVSLIILAGFLTGAIYIKTNKNKDEAQLPPNSEIALPDNYDEASTPKKQSVPTEVQRGDIIDSNMPRLEKPQLTIDTSKDYVAVMNTTKGKITIDLAEKTAPNTVNNFVYLASNQFYNNVIFHRIISGFMIQGGDPTGTGSGGPGYTFEDEPFEGEYTRGTIAMANAGPNTNGSQFFIMHQNNKLPKNYVIFGKVTEGLEVVDAIANAEVEPNNLGELSSPVNPDSITGVEILIR